MSVHRKLGFDAIAAVGHGGVVLAAQHPADGRQTHVSILSHEVHRHLARLGGLLVAFATLEGLLVYAVVCRDSVDDHIVENRPMLIRVRQSVDSPFDQLDV